MAESGTYDQATIARRQKIAEAMLGDAMKPQKIEHWAQGLAQLGRAGIGGYMSHQANEDAKAEEYEQNAAIYRQAGMEPPPRPKSAPSIFDRVASAMSGGGQPAPETPVAAPAGPPSDQASYPPPTAPPESPTVFRPGIAAPASNLPRGIRNNNPLNIEAGGFTQSQPGYVGSDGRFARFDSPQSGVGAAGKLLDTYEKKHGLNTVAGIIGRWAPAGDGNNVSAYASAVAKQMGIDPNAPIPPEMRPQLIAAMGKHENGRPIDMGQQPYQVAGPPTAAPQAPLAQAMTPPTMPSAPSGMFANVPKEKLPAILQGLTSKNPTMKALAVQELGNYTKANAPTDNIREFEYGQRNPAFAKRQEALKASGPQWSDTGEIDPQTGQPIKGWVDPRDKSVAPYRPQAAVPAQPSTVPPVPTGVDPKVWRESQSKRAAEEGMSASGEVTSKLRNEIQGLPSYKNIAQAAPVYKSMTEAAGRDNRAADVNLIYGMAKIMDPGSVVRESEMTVAQAIATLPQQLQAALKSQMTESGRLTPELRQMIMQEARSRILAYQGMFDQDAGMYRGIARDSRMNEAHVLPTFGPFDEFKSPTAPAAPVVIDGYKIKAK